MKFKFYYVKHKVTGEFVAFTTSSNNQGDTFTSLFLSRWDSDQPYLSTKEHLQRMAKGELNDSWDNIVNNCIKKAIQENQLEIIEVEL
ncbi:hypothetical protein CJ20_052 [Escherichia phage CJ20]|nr:hypothetical protein CJ20_052 [Escherichia phage CJ20]